MKLFENRFGRLVTRRWSDDEQVGINVAFTLPAGTIMRERWENFMYRLVRRHPRVKAKELLLLAQRDHVEFCQTELEAAVETMALAVEEAQMMYDHTQEVVEIIRLYQNSLHTLCAPDPHEARVKVVVEDFFAQFKDRYDRHDG